MTKIYKYLMEITSYQQIKMPLSAKILKIAEQNNKLYLWAMVNNTNHTYDMEIKIIGTGFQFKEELDRYEYVETVIMSDGFVWHIFIKHIEVTYGKYEEK
jgi:hypothetical protein